MSKTEQAPETQAATMLSVDQLATLSPSELMAYVSQLQANMKAASGLISEARSKQTSAARAELEQSLRNDLRFPTLTAETLKAVNDANAAGFVVIYSLESGHGTVALTWKKHPSGGGGGSGVTKKDGTPREPRAGDRKFSEDYEQYATEEDKAEDTAKIESRVKESMERGSFNGKEGAARNSISWQIKQRRLHLRGVAGY